MSADNAVFPSVVWTLGGNGLPAGERDERSAQATVSSGRRLRTSRVILSGGTIVLADTIIEGGSVVIEDGRIAGIFHQAHGRSGVRGELFVDTHGRIVMPGLVDLHNDNLEAEINPRPRANLPVPLALATLDRRLAASGVTTEFDAVFFADMTRNERKLEDAPARSLAALVHAAGPRALVDHNVLFRVDLWNPGSLAMALKASEAARVPLISLNDHTPGQGQYRDVDQFKRYWRDQLGKTQGETDEEAARQMSRAAERPDILGGVLDAVREAAKTRDLIIMSHDDDSPERVDVMYAVGARIAEFPVTVEAARRHRQLGMATTAGAPNIVRGGSASGNISASELLAEGLIDILCADYHAPSLLVAVLQLVRSGFMSLPRAVRLVTLHPARAVRLDGEIGSLALGLQADIIVVDPSEPVPTVELGFRRGEICYYAPARRGSLGPICEIAHTGVYAVNGGVA